MSNTFRLPWRTYTAGLLLRLFLPLLLFFIAIYGYFAGYGRGLYVEHLTVYVPESTWETVQHRSYLYDGPRQVCEVSSPAKFSPTGNYAIFNGVEGVMLFKRGTERPSLVPTPANLVLESCLWDETHSQAAATIHKPSDGSNERKIVVKLP